jgi:hypothetical protein
MLYIIGIIPESTVVVVMGCAGRKERCRPQEFRKGETSLGLMYR